MSPIDLGLTACGLANIAAFGAFAFDKQQARDGGWRVSETSLLTWTLFGGLGAWMAQHILRHKTRKEPFRSRMGVMLTCHVLGLIGLFVWLLA